MHMATSTRACKQDNSPAQPGLPPVYYQLHSLLHTLHSFAEHEEEICSLLSEIKRSGKVGARVRKELSAALDALPVHALQTDFDASWQALDDETPASAAA